MWFKIIAVTVLITKMINHSDLTFCVAAKGLKQSELSM